MTSVLVIGFCAALEGTSPPAIDAEIFELMNALRENARRGRSSTPILDALAGMGERSMPAVARCLDDPEIRSYCAEILLLMPEEIAIPVLRDAIERAPDVSTKARLIATLGGFRSCDTLGFLERMYEMQEEKSQGLALPIAWALQSVTGREYGPSGNPRRGPADCTFLVRPDHIDMVDRAKYNTWQIQRLTQDLAGCGTTQDERVRFESLLWANVEETESAATLRDLLAARGGCLLVEIDRALRSPVNAVRSNALRILPSFAGRIQAPAERRLASELVFRSLRSECEHLGLAIDAAVRLARVPYPYVGGWGGDIAAVLMEIADTERGEVAQEAVAALRSISGTVIVPESWKARQVPSRCDLRDMRELQQSPRPAP